MLGVFRHILYLLLAFVLQTTWVHYLEILGVKPDLILLVLVFVAIASGHLEATALGFVFGLCQDAYSPDGVDLGLNALSKSLLGFAVGIGRGRLMADTLQVQILIVACAVLVHDLIYFAGHSGVALSAVPYFLVRYGLPRAIYTSLLASLVAVVMRTRKQLEAE